MKLFWSISIEEVQERAQELLKRRLTDKEMRSVQNMFDNGILWTEVLDIAIMEVK